MTTVKVEVDTFLNSPQLWCFTQDYKNDASKSVECKTNKMCQLYGQIDKQEVKREKHVRIEG